MLVTLAALPWEYLVPITVFAAVVAMAWWLIDVFSSNSPRAEERLEELRKPVVRRKADDMLVQKKSSSMTSMLAKAAPALSKPLQPKTGEEEGKIRARLVQAGYRHEAHPSIFLGLKFAGLVMGLVIGGGTLLLTQGITQGSLMKAGLLGGLFFYLPDIVVWFIAKQRKDAIFLGLPDALDLMVVCVEAGLGLDQAMRKVSDEMKRTCPVVAEEFGICNFQLQMGRPRTEVLHELGSRTGVDDLRSLAAILIQADKFGSSIAQALRVQSDAMRTRRRQLAEEKAAKTAVKLIFPLVIFIFPAIFVVLVGPAAITMVNEMFPIMGGK
jgi:tight adherence protein C